MKTTDDFHGAPMTDYYEELDLDRSLDLDELNRELNKRESIWKRRRTMAPEKAVKMLGEIVDAREVFKTEYSRSQYDRKLEEAIRGNNGTSIEEAELANWLNEAESYLDAGQGDLARIAFERASLFQKTGQETPEYFYIGARVYESSGKREKALDYVNKAILLDPSNADYELTKNIILENSASSSSLTPFEQRELHKKASDSARIAIEKARRSGDLRTEALATGSLAFILYFKLDQKDDIVEDLARHGVELGDEWGNARRVLTEFDAIHKRENIELQKRLAIERQANEARQRAVERDRRIRLTQNRVMSSPLIKKSVNVPTYTFNLVENNVRISREDIASIFIEVAVEEGFSLVGKVETIQAPNVPQSTEFTIRRRLQRYMILVTEYGYGFESIDIYPNNPVGGEEAVRELMSYAIERIRVKHHDPNCQLEAFKRIGSRIVVAADI